MQSQFRLSKVLLLTLLALLFAATFAIAQVNRGAISGTVVDPSGAALVGAQVKATSVGTGQASTTTSDNTGTFHLAQLPTGLYNLEMTKSGFRKTAMSGVLVAAAVDNSLGAVKMEVGGASETVEVTAAPPLVQSTEAQVSATFSTTELQNIPGIQENQGLDILAILLPGVNNNRDLGFSNTNGVGFTVNGLRGRNNDQQIDGQNNNDNSVAGPGIFLGDAEFVDQYQVTTSNFGPEYGRNAGSVVNVITKSGGNTWHGSVYGTESNSILNSLSNIQRAPTSGIGEGLTRPPHFNDGFWGATIGGPLVKNKVFLFAGYDTELFISKFLFQTTGSSGNFTPTPAGINQMASCYTSGSSLQSIAALQKFGPYGIGGGNPQPLGDVNTQTLFSPDVPNGTIPDPAGGSPIPVCFVDTAGVQRTLGNSSHQYDWITKLDFTGAHDTVTGRYLWQKISNFNADSFVSGFAALGYPNNVPSTGQQVGVNWVHRFGDRMTNEVRLNYSRLRVEFGGNSIGNTVPGQGQLESAVANVLFSDPTQAGFGPATNAPQGRIVNTYQLQDNWIYAMGKHQLKAGVNYSYQRSPNLFLPNVNGQFRFADWTAFALNQPTAYTIPCAVPPCTTLAGGPNRIRIALGNDNLDFREHDSFFYFGDDWKVSNSLTMNLGLTYSYYGQPANLFHTQTVKQQTGPNPFWDPTLPLNVTTFPSIPAPKSSFGPSIGFAYSPQWGGFLTGNGKTVFRGGYRLSYDPPFYNIYLNISSAAPVVLLQSLTGGAAHGNGLLAAPLGPNVRAQLASVVTPGVFDPRRFNSTSITPNFGPDRVHEWSFGLQRELGAHAAFEARYIGNHGQNLFQSVAGNPKVDMLVNSFPNLFPGVTPCADPPVGNPSALGHLHCDLPSNLRTRTNTAYSDYNGLQTEFRTNNLFKQLTMKTTYTYSKTTDNASEIFGTFAGGGTNAFSQNPLDVKGPEHGLSGLDFRHNWNLSFSEAFPFYRSQHGVVGHVLGGWVVAGSYIISSGQPYTPVQFFFNTFTGGCGGGGCSDTSFTGAFIGTFDNLRPFSGNPSAPATSVGAFAGDTCAFAGIGCELALDQLLDWSAMNSTGAETQVTKAQVRYILNGAEANSIFGTPFGNVGRNGVRDYFTNTGNFQVAKIIKWGERVNITWHMSMVNAFNHPNYGYNGAGSTTFGGIDPFVDADAGLAGSSGAGTGFGDPKVFDGGHRIIRFGLKVAF